MLGQVIAINCDNASNNDTMAEDLEVRSTSEGFDFDAQESRLRCMPHTVHLAALEVIQSKIHPICNLFSYSCLRALVQSNVTRKRMIYIKIRLLPPLTEVSMMMQLDKKRMMTETMTRLSC